MPPLKYDVLGILGRAVDGILVLLFLRYVAYLYRGRLRSSLLLSRSGMPVDSKVAH